MQARRVLQQPTGVTNRAGRTLALLPLCASSCAAGLFCYLVCGQESAEPPSLPWA
jgi:hypothetical protein